MKRRHIKYILIVNACVRTDSKTLQLARHLLQGLKGDVTEINLEEENIAPLKRKTLEERETLLREGRIDDASFQYSERTVPRRGTDLYYNSGRSDLCGFWLFLHKASC